MEDVQSLLEIIFAVLFVVLYVPLIVGIIAIIPTALFLATVWWLSSSSRKSV